MSESIKGTVKTMVGGSITYEFTTPENMAEYIFKLERELQKYKDGLELYKQTVAEYEEEIKELIATKAQ